MLAAKIKGGVAFPHKGLEFFVVKVTGLPFLGQKQC